MKKIEAGIFDAGGVLVENPDKYTEQDIIETFALEEEVFHQTWKQLVPDLQKGLITEEQLWQKFLILSGSTQPLPQGESLLTRQARQSFCPINENLELVKTLKEKGLKLAVLSNTESGIVELWGSLGIYDYFDVKIFSNEVGLKKPDLAIFKVCMERLGVESAFFVDDIKENLPPELEELGIIGIHAIKPKQIKKEIRRLGIKI